MNLPPPKIRKNPCTFSRLPNTGAPAVRGTRRHRAGALLHCLCTGLLALAAMAVSVPAGADDIVGNEHGANNGHVVLGSSNDAAQAFTTGAYPRTGVTLTKIDCKIKNRRRHDRPDDEAGHRDRSGHRGRHVNNGPVVLAPNLSNVERDFYTEHDHEARCIDHLLGGARGWFG